MGSAAFKKSLLETVSVLQYGARGDGLTDDAAAIQAAITYCEDHDLILELTPGKTYKLDSTLTFKHGRSSIDTKTYHVRVRGNNATLLPSAGVTAIQVNPRCLFADRGTGRGEADIDISELTIDGANASTTGKALLIGAAGMWCSNFAWSQLDDITVQNFAPTTIVVQFDEARHFEVNALSIRAGIMAITAQSANSFCGDMVFTTCEFAGSVADPPINITSSASASEVRGITFFACDIYGSGSLISSTGTNSQVGDIWFSGGCQFDGPSAGAGEVALTVQASGTGSQVFQVHLIGTYWASFTGAALHAVSSVTATVKQLAILGGGLNTMTTDSGSGDAVFNFLEIEGVSVRGVEFDAITTSGGQYINVDGCVDVMVHDNKGTNSATIVNGISIGNASDRYSILSNMFNATTNAVNDYTAGSPSRQVANNLLI